ncbi:MULTISPECIES: ABC transporter ATP-binding protein [Lactococcus]|jgi:multidrug/hemolysin transport system ATP-binding protein|uniref:ABC transporter ATP-binding protein n=2 Tax=Lactococcus TaxID=1357 RepID=A0A252CB18_9LACT|nr:MULTISPECIES: ABC transporter ATP-binding protein [Lactococcus]OUK03752.1 ABC transporter ATP-binding protein [Lactococcus petauri]USI65613.1 ABC transporter ATP-binding protein [Lactococcus petauri]USI68075.1 ABC transporter ATP-binding protein [Lactococcus petauri]USJ20335.1 ABC transporter ATP-binding protein [Lactococcus formosensis]WJE12735.1 ABC transporter ATP-binding protein [Lactococcus petauri]
MKIILKDIEKKYGNFEALKGISTEFEEGKFYGLLGPNGAGKTTLFNILIQAIKKTSGSIEWQIEGEKVKADRFYNHIGIVFQSSRLDESLTVEENLITRGALYGMNKKEVLYNLEKIEKYLSIGELNKRRYGMLSGGQKRKVDIARALLHNPSILLLDEPTTGLDPKSRNDLWKAIYELNKKEKMTVVLITHYLEEMIFCDQLNVLVQGSLHYSGTIEEFIQKNSSTNLKIVLKNINDILSNQIARIPEHVKDKIYIYRNITMEEILNILSENQYIIENFEVQSATLEAAYLNLLKETQGV